MVVVPASSTRMRHHQARIENTIDLITEIASRDRRVSFIRGSRTEGAEAVDEPGPRLMDNRHRYNDQGQNMRQYTDPIAPGGVSNSIAPAATPAQGVPFSGGYWVQN